MTNSSPNPAQVAAAVPESSPERTPKYDAFISYSHKDAPFAKSLEKALRAYKPPRDLPLPPRRLNVFRDQSDIVGVELTRALESILESSAKLIVLCSPASRLSIYVNREIEAFARIRGADHIVPILVSGIPNDEAGPGRESEMAFAPALIAQLHTPLAAEFRGFRPGKDRIESGAYEQGWFKALADLYSNYGVTRAQIEQRERRGRARQRALAASAIASVMVALAGLSLWALSERSEVIRQRDTAISRQLASQSRSRSIPYPDLALLLAAAAYRNSATVEARENLDVNLNARPRLRKFLWGHSGDLASVAFSPDGRRLVAGGEDDHKIVLWDVVSGRILLDFLAHQDSVQRVVFSLDGKRLLSAGKDGTIKVWDAATGTEIRAIGRPAGDFLETFDVSPDGRRLVSAMWRGTLQVWDTQSGALLVESKPHTSGISNVVFSPDGTRIASTSSEGTVALWDGTAEHPPRVLSGFENGSTDLAFSPDGAMVAVAHGANRVQLLAVETGEVVGSLEAAAAGNTSERKSIAFSVDGTRLVMAGALTHIATVWDVASRQRIASLAGEEYGVHAIAFSHDGKRFASVAGDGFVRFWETEHWTKIEESQGGVQCLAFSPDDRTLATCGTERAVLWDVAAPQFAATLHKHPERVGAVQFSHDGRYLVSTSFGRDVAVWNVRDREPAAFFQPQRAPDLDIMGDQGLSPFAFSPDGKMLAVTAPGERFGEGGRRYALNLWDFAGTGNTTLLKGHTSAIAAVAWRPGGGQLAAADSRRVLLWDVQTSALRVLRAGGGALTLAFDRSGTRLAAGASNDVLLWDLASDTPPLEFSGHERPVRYVAFTPDGRTLISAGFDGSVRFWNTTAGPTQKPSVGRHTADINGLALSVDGRFAATASRDGSVGLWNVEGGTLLRLLKGHTGEVQAVAFSPDAQIVASASEADGVILWEVATGQEVTRVPTGATRIAFSPDGRLLAMGGGADNAIVLRDAEFAKWPDRACAVANRNLSCEEWRQYLHEAPYQAVCPQLPSPQDCDAPASLITGDTSQSLVEPGRGAADHRPDPSAG